MTLRAKAQAVVGAADRWDGRRHGELTREIGQLAKWLRENPEGEEPAPPPAYPVAFDHVPPEPVPQPEAVRCWTTESRRYVWVNYDSLRWHFFVIHSKEHWPSQASVEDADRNQVRISPTAARQLIADAGWPEGLRAFDEKVGDCNPPYDRGYTDEELNNAVEYLAALPPPPVSPETLEARIRGLIESGAVHRSGVNLKTVLWSILFNHLDDEITELKEAIDEGDPVHICEELGDVLGIVIHAVLKTGHTMAQVEEQEIKKLDERFSVGTCKQSLQVEPEPVADKLPEWTEATGSWSEVTKVPEPLLPCPFCGSEAIDPKGWKSNDGRYGPECDDCGATAESLEAWNKRPEQVAKEDSAVDAKCQEMIARLEDLKQELVGDCEYDKAVVARDGVRALRYWHRMAVVAEQERDRLRECIERHNRLWGTLSWQETVAKIESLTAENERLKARVVELCDVGLSLQVSRDYWKGNSRTVTAHRRLRNDNGPSGELGAPEQFISVDGLFYRVSWVKSAVGFRESDLVFASLKEKAVQE